MATRYWTGLGTTGDWSSTGNWSASTVPISGDTVILSTDGEDLTTGLSQSGVTLAELRIGPQWTGKIGTSSTSLSISATKFDFASGADDTYIRGTFTTLNVQGGKNRSNMLQLSDSVITTMRVIGGLGTITLGTDGELTTLECIGANNITIVMTAEGSSGNAGLANVTIDSGNISIGSNISAVCEVFGGQLTMTDAATIATLDIYDGAVCKYNSSGTITNLNMYGGTWTASDNTSSSVTVTNATMYDGVINERNYVSSLVWTNGITIHSGEVVYEPGRSITIT